MQIDHVVALGDAWQSGAQSLTLTTRTLFGNDPYNLLAVDGSLNEQKGDANAASWLPPNGSYRCQYVARQVGVKVKYGLSVTAPERDSIARVLATCPGQPLPPDPGTVVVPAPVAPPNTTPAPPAPASTPASSVPVAVHPGAFCTPGGRDRRDRRRHGNGLQACLRWTAALGGGVGARDRPPRPERWAAA